MSEYNALEECDDMQWTARPKTFEERLVERERRDDRDEEGG